jgi:threonine aldolase
MPSFNRRNFLKTSSAGLLPALVPLPSVFASDANQVKWSPPNAPIIKLYGDGEIFNPGDYLNELQKANAAVAIEQDWYGKGGAIEQLEKKFLK